MRDGWIRTWGEIAKYIGTSTKTAKKWAKKYGLPVRRLPGGGVAAIKAELDLWLIKFDENLEKLKKKGLRGSRR